MVDGNAVVETVKPSRRSHYVPSSSAPTHDSSSWSGERLRLTPRGLGAVEAWLSIAATYMWSASPLERWVAMMKFVKKEWAFKLE
jgi:hypothetical protein